MIGKEKWTRCQRNEKYYAGKEPSMRTTIMTEDQLGPFNDSNNK